jgi:hypothetical protein
MCTMVWWYRMGLTPNSSTRALCQPPVLSGDPVSRDSSGASGRMGEGNENLVYPSPWDFEGSLTYRKILRHGTSGFTSIRRKVCCGYLSSLSTLRSRVSSGSIVSDYGLDDREIGVRSPAGAKDFSSSLCIQTGSGAHPASCTMGTGSPFPGAKARQGRDADHSPPSSAEVVNE